MRWNATVCEHVCLKTHSKSHVQFPSVVALLSPSPTFVMGLIHYSTSSNTVMYNVLLWIYPRNTRCFSHVSLPWLCPPALLATPLLEIEIWHHWDPLGPSAEGFQLLLHKWFKKTNQKDRDINTHTHIYIYMYITENGNQLGMDANIPVISYLQRKEHKLGKGMSIVAVRNISRN